MAPRGAGERAAGSEWRTRSDGVELALKQCQIHVEIVVGVRDLEVCGGCEARTLGRGIGAGPVYQFDVQLLLGARIPEVVRGLAEASPHERERHEETDESGRQRRRHE